MSIALPLVAIILSIIAISGQRAMAISLQKDRLAGLQNKPEQHFQRLTSTVNGKNIMKSQRGQSQDINELKSTMEASLEEIKTKLSSKLKVLLHTITEIKVKLKTEKKCEF